MMSKEEFYQECDRLFGQEHEPPTTRKYLRRWGQRTPGSGRFEGYGIVRWFSPYIVHIALRYPIKLQTYTTASEALIKIAEIMGK